MKSAAPVFFPGLQLGMVSRIDFFGIRDKVQVARSKGQKYKARRLEGEQASLQPESQPESRPESQPESQPESRPESLESRVLRILAIKPANKTEISSQLGQKKVSGQLNKVIRDLLAAKRIGYTIPNKPNSRLQKYRLRH
jgi:hypothetical protein